MFAWKRKAMSYIIRSSSVSTLDFGLSDRNYDNFEKKTHPNANRVLYVF